MKHIQINNWLGKSEGILVLDTEEIPEDFITRIDELDTGTQIESVASYVESEYGIKCSVLKVDCEFRMY